MGLSSPERAPSDQPEMPQGLERVYPLGSVMLDGFRGHEIGLPGAVLEIRRIPGLPENFYNVAVLRVSKEPDSTVMLLGRYVEKRGEPGQPDTGPLAVTVIDKGAAQPLAKVWWPEQSNMGDQLEDARAVESPDGRVTLGWTRLAQSAERYEPFPAFSITTAQELLGGQFPDTHHITGLGKSGETIPIGGGPKQFHLLPGKNTTPFGSGNFVFRPEKENHLLLTFSLDEKGEASDIRRLEFKKKDIPDWGESRMGSTMPPIWLNDREAIFLVHGIKFTQGKHRYSIGSARLFRDEAGGYAIDNISKDPILTPESFNGFFEGEQVELHPQERQALYLCGGFPIYDSEGKPRLIKTYPSVGDTRTVEATLSVDEIVRDWQRSEPAQRSPSF